MQKVIVVSGPYASADKEWIVQGKAGHMLVLIRWIGFGSAEHAEVNPANVRFL